jgi:hypothetical protein
LSHVLYYTVATEIALARDLMTIRLEPTARARLRAAASRRGLTPSASVRVAIDAWLVAEDALAGTRPYDELADLLGRVEHPMRTTAVRSSVKKPQRGRRGGAR